MRTLPDLFYANSITLIPKPDSYVKFKNKIKLKKKKKKKKKRNYEPIFLIKVDAKFLNKTLSN